jgi:lipopolysaccharide transport system ATP-binding protein
MPDNLPILELSGVSKHFAARLRIAMRSAAVDAVRALTGRGGRGRQLRAGEFLALDDVSFTLGRGEAVGILGNNGSGKTTLLKLVYGILKPDGGRIRVRGRMHGLIELGAGLDSLLSGRENIALWATTIPRAGRAEAQRVAEAFSELADDLDKPVAAYSSGMKARLSFSLLVASAADLLLIDEALAVGDNSFQRKCLDFLAGHVARGGSLLLTSHQVAHIETICDRTIVLDKGRVVHVGDVAGGFAIAHMAHWVASSAMAAVPLPSGATPDFHVTAVGVKGPDGGDAEAGAPMDIVVDYAARTSFAICWNFAFWSSDGAVTIGGDVQLEPMAISPGSGRLRCRIDRLPLRPGSYRLGIAITQSELLTPLALYGWPGGGLPICVHADPGFTYNIARENRQLIRIEARFEDVPSPIDDEAKATDHPR